MPEFNINVKLELTVQQIETILSWAASVHELSDEPFDLYELDLEAKLKAAVGRR